MNSQLLTSRLVARLKSVFAVESSVLFTHDWREKATPANEIYWAHSSKSSKLALDLQAWPTPNYPNGGRHLTVEQTITMRSKDGKKIQVSMNNIAQITGERSVFSEGDIAAWATPNTMDFFTIRSDESLKRAKSKAGCSNLKDQVPVSAWPTPMKNDDNHSRTSDPQAYAERSLARPKSGTSLALYAQCYATYGQEYAETQPELSCVGQLNPALSRWAMGYPQEWCMSSIKAFLQAAATDNGKRKKK